MNGYRIRERHSEHDQIYGGLLNEMEELLIMITQKFKLPSQKR